MLSYATFWFSQKLNFEVVAGAMFCRDCEILSYVNEPKLPVFRIEIAVLLALGIKLLASDRTSNNCE